MSETISSSTPVARKKHVCSWCGETIPKGTKYDRWTGIHDGEFQSSAMHCECAKAFLTSDMGEYFPGEYERGSTHDHGCECELHAKR